jgi:hypothetical protein
MFNETFLEKMREMVPKIGTFISASEFYQLFNEKFPELESTIHYNEDCEINWVEIYRHLLHKCDQQFKFQSLFFSLFFKHFYHLGLLIGTATPL